MKNMKVYASDFIEAKRAAGYLYEAGAYWLNRYIEFHESDFPDCLYPTKESVCAFADTIPKGDSYGICPIREFASYLRVLGVDAYVYKGNMKKKEPDPPYIITDSEGDAFFRVVDDTTDCVLWVGKKYVFPAFLRTMWCCGIRTKEGRVLRCEHVHLEDGYFDIMDAKGHKDRRIFFNQEFRKYLLDYDREISLVRPGRLFFFPGKSDEAPIGKGTIPVNFKNAWYKAFPDFDRTIRIRPYDFRHHFVYANINRWLKEGEDVNVMSYYLMQVTGHKTLNQLLYYFHLVPEIYGAIKEKAKDLDCIVPDEYYLEEEDD